MARPLNPSQKIIVASATALCLFSVFTWFDGHGASHPSHNAWSNPLSGIGVLISTFMLLQISLARHPHVRLPTPRLPWGQVQFLLGALALGLVLLQVLIGDGGRHRQLGAFLGVLAAGGLTYGGFRASREF